MVIPEFIKENFSLICVLTYFLLSIIILLVRMLPRGGLKTLEKQKILEVYEAVPKFIATAEELFGSGNGPLKLKFVLNSINEIIKISGVDIKENWTAYIESILITPEKKGESP